MNTVVKQAEQKIVSAAKRSVLLDMAERHGMEPQAFEAVIRATCLPPDRKTGRQATREEFAAFLLVAKEYDLNPLTKEIFAFVGKNGGIQPIVSVDGWANLVNSNPAFDGMKFYDHLTDDGRLTAITCEIFRKDREHSISATEYMSECKRNTEPWQQWPHRMLRHKAFIQAARYAFGFAGISDQDDIDRMADEADRIASDLARDVSPRQRPASVKDAFDEFSRIEPPADEPHDPDTGEISESDSAVVWEETESPAAPADNLPSSPTAGAVPTADDYVERWTNDIDAAVPKQAEQLNAAWNEEKKLRNKITWPDDDTFANLQRKVKAALEMLRKG